MLKHQVKCWILLALIISMSIKEYLSVYSFNATGISGADKLSDFNNSFTGQTFDVISITETWFHDGILDTEILTNLNYELFRKDRNHETSVKKRWWGDACYT